MSMVAQKATDSAEFYRIFHSVYNAVVSNTITPRFLTYLSKSQFRKGSSKKFSFSLKNTIFKIVFLKLSTFPNILLT
jgi:hypothetical protein